MSSNFLLHNYIERLSELLLDNVSDAIISTDENFRIKTWNKAAEKIYGLSLYDVKDKKTDDILHYEFADDSPGHSKKKLNEEGEWKGIVIFTCPDNRKIFLSASVCTLRNENNEVIGHVFVNRDITERKTADEALLKAKAELVKSIERYQYASMATSDAIWDWDIATDTIYRGEGFKTLFGYKEAMSSLEIRMSNIIHPDDKERVRTELENALSGDALNWQSEYRFKCADGNYKQVIDKAYIIRNEKGDAVRMIGAVQDVTEQRRLQEQLANEEERKKKEVLQAIIYAQERERNEISHELHDNVSQILTTCKLLVEAAVQQDDKKFLQQTKENLQKAIDEIRKISHRLNPATLKYIGLEGSINDLVSNINHTGNIHITFLPSLPEAGKLNDDIQLALFRIVQEQLNNVLKHANARNVVISLSQEKEKINLTISDDGTGYDLRAKKHGLGLRNIFNRTEFHKGTAQIFTEPGRGFKLQVQIPS